MRMFALVVLVSLGCSAAAAGQTPHDGIWNVTILTKTGSCEPTAQYSVTVAGGKISGPQKVTGVVDREGRVRASIGSAQASGQLEARAAQEMERSVRRHSVQRSLGGIAAIIQHPG